MDKFKNKIPPTILTLLFLIFNYILSFNFLKIDVPYKYFCTTLLLILGFYIIIRSSRLFAQAKTSIDPLRPFKSANYIKKFLTLTKDIIPKKESDRFLKDIQNLRKLKSNQLHKLNIEINNRNIKKNNKIGIF